MPNSTSTVVTSATWATGFLTAIGAPVTQNNINNVVAWGTAESGKPGSRQGPAGGWSNYNPLNVVTQSNDRHTYAGGSQGNIASFGNVDDGVNATARLFLGNKNAAPIIQTLRADGSRDQLNSAVNRFYGSWGGSIHLPGSTGDANTPIGDGATQPDVQLSGASVDGIGKALKEAAGVLVLPGKGLGDVLDVLKHSGLNPLESLGVWAASELLYLGEIVGGFSLIVLGVVIVLVDTGTLSKMPVPVPV